MSSLTVSLAAAADFNVILNPNPAGDITYPGSYASTTTNGDQAMKWKNGAVYYTRWALLRFDTSGLGSGATVTAAKLRLYFYTGESNTDSRNFVGEYYTWTPTAGSGDWPASGSIGTTGWSVGLGTITSGAVTEFTLANLGSINTTGVTGFRMGVSGGAPTGFNTPGTFEGYGGVDLVPELVITYTTPTAPAAPTLGTITPGNAQLSAAFTAGSDGGSAITSYKYSTDNGATYLTRQTGTTASPIVITTLSADGTTPLVNGTSYTVLIKAVNAVGDGTASNSVAATPSTTPDAPTALVATGGNAQVSVAFTAGATGGSSLTSYKYSTDNGSTYRTRQTGTTASPLVITTLSSDGTTPLVNGTTYQIRLKAVNANGDGTASSAVAGTPGNPSTNLKAALTMRVGGL